MRSTDSNLDPNLVQALQHLRQVRLALLNLHKALLNSERVVYEQFHGRIQSNNEFFQLVTGHEWFAWLRPISQFIVQTDDVLRAKEPVSVADVDQLLETARQMLQPDENGTTLEKQYYRAIQRDPEIAIMHRELSKLLEAEV